MLITIEGPDKAGKTTQLRLLKDYATKNNLDWLFTRNPGGTPLGTELRNIVLDSKQNISDLAELMIYLADRADHVAEVLKPAITAGKTVICDRFTDSTVAYQGYGRGIDIKAIEAMNNLVCDGVKPALTILLMVSAQVALARAGNAEKDRLEKENKLFFIRVRNGYNVLARENPTRIKIIEVDNLTPEEVHQELITLIENKIKYG